MAVEQTNTIEGLVSTNPRIIDPVHNGPDHLWLIKNVLKKTFPGKNGNGFSKPITANEDEINSLAGLNLTPGQTMADALDSKVNKDGDTMTGPLAVLDPVSDDDAVTKRYVDTLVKSITPAGIVTFPRGTAMLFAQDSAPPGWTRVTGDAADNRMLRVVPTNGGGIGGFDDPTVNGKVPSHSHGFSTSSAGDHAHNGSGTTGSSGAAHTHNVSGNTGGQSANHTHGFSGTTDGQGQHQHSGVARTDIGGGFMLQGGGPHPVGFGVSDPAGHHAHNVSGVTGGVTADHSHSFNVNTSASGGDHSHGFSFQTSGVGGHSHGGTTNANEGASTWQPRYLNIIVATKD
jgi:hypothetical protein